MAESGHHYVYDTAGNIASKQVEKPGLAATMTTYGHNSLNQLTAIGGSGGVKTVVVRGETSEPASVKVRPGTSSTWKDARMLAGQRFEADIDLATGPNQINVQATDGSYNTSTYTYALDLATAPAATPTFDAEGNMTSDGIRAYEWDLQNRLIKITWGAGSNKTTEFRYNPLGQRSQRIEKTGATTAQYYYLYDGIRLLCRYTGGTALSNLDRRYFNEGEQRKNGTLWDAYYYTRDHLGSVREVLASNGTLVARYDYDPYGKRSAQYETGTYADGCDLGYTGHITQPSPVTGQTELVMTLFRAYDPELGRWLSADPIGEEGGINLYAYVLNGPMDAVDLLGLDLILLSRNVSGDEASDYIFASQLIKKRNIGGDNTFDVHGHGCRTGVWDDRNATPARLPSGERKVNHPDAKNREFIGAEALATRIQNSGSWKPGMPIVLFTCNGSACGSNGESNLASALAQILADRTMVAQEVSAPNGNCKVERNLDVTVMASSDSGSKRPPKFYTVRKNPK